MSATQKAALDSSAPDGLSKYVDEPHPVTITLKWADIDNNLVQVLRSIANDLQKFTK